TSQSAATVHRDAASSPARRISVDGCLSLLRCDTRLQKFYSPTHPFHHQETQTHCRLKASSRTGFYTNRYSKAIRQLFACFDPAGRDENAAQPWRVFLCYALPLRIGFL